MTKFCPKCQLDHPIDNFYNTHNGNKAKHCKRCHCQLSKEAKIKRRAKAKTCPIAKASHEKELKYNKALRARNPELTKQKQRTYYHANKDKISVQRRLLREVKAEASRVRERITKNLYTKSKRESDLSYKLLVNLRNRIYQAVSRKSECSKDLLGCNLQQFISHLESQFTPEMSWDNYGSYWSIDHIKPCCSFDLEVPENQRICFNWANCRPLPVAENSRKGNTEDREKRINRENSPDSRV